MLFRNLLAAVLSAGAVAAIPAQSLSKKSVDFNWGAEKVQGLNIGGWLLLEPWITPSIFQALDQSLGIVDEYTLTEKLGSDAAYKILKPHWDSWCTFEDFKKIADAGFNTVRIPVGYWAYSLDSGEPYTQGAAPYIDAAIDWARATGLKVWIDLHGAPLSQNGFDNSGHRISKPGWQGGNSTAQTLAVLKIITEKYAQTEYHDVVVAIELLNEPLSSALNFDEIKQFYKDGFDQVRAVSDTPVMFHDAFVAPRTFNGFLSVSDNNAQNVIVDHHEYQVFTNDLVALQPWEHRQKVCNNVASYASGSDKWVVVGEWSGAMTDCAPALNGYGIGARYDGTYSGSTYVGSCADKNNIANWNETFKGDMRGYLEAQLSAFERQTQGWVFWNFKTEAAHEWDAFVLLDGGIFPQPLNKYTYESICS
ncbi:glucan 1,3-beta-glucosidase precursor [Diplocarpon rosae]|nr:glucan 1,3-beta-glucosidase precursor [Diplocarpon rosae]